MMDSLPLFDRPPAHVRGSQTSQAAASQIDVHAGRMREAVLEFILQRGHDGAVDEEIEQGLRMKLDTARARRCELRDQGLVRDSGRHRATASGRAAVVWIATSQLSTPNSQPAISCNERGSRSASARAEATGDRSPAYPARAPGETGPSIPPPIVGASKIPPVCPRCKRTEFRDLPVHQGRSTRRDCAGCGLALGFPIWHGRPAAGGTG